MKKILDVPLIHQRYPMDCGVACLSMVMTYDGVKNKYADLIKKFDANKKDFKGLYLYEMGSLLIDKGYDVTFQSLNTIAFNKKQRSLDQQGIKDHVLWLRDKRYAESKTFKPALDKFVDFTDKGGMVEVKLPTLEDLRAEIDNGRPIIASVTNHFLYGLRVGHNMHFVTIIGYDNQNFYVNDTGKFYNSGRFTNKYKNEDMLYAIYSNTCGDIDNGSILKTRPRLG